MTTIYAGQHIYANVEKEQSPHNHGGLQTLFYTRSALSESESEAMEAYLPYWRSEDESVKHVFFTTSTGKSVVAHIVPLTGVDREGREGRYLAHSLVFTPEAFAPLGADPFWVLQHFHFLTTVEQALEHGDFLTGDIPAVALEVPGVVSCNTAAVRDWATPELHKLALLALRAKHLAHDRKAVAFVGDPQQIHAALEAAFFAVPTPLRSYCTFDTSFNLKKRNFGATYCWAIGEPEPPSDSKFTLVDTCAHQVSGTLTAQPETAYERWVLHALEHHDLDTIATSKEQAFALCEWLDGRTDAVSLSDATRPEVVVSAFGINAQQVQACLRRRLREQLPLILVTRLFEPIYTQTEPVELFKHLQQGLALPYVMEVLYQVYAAQNFRARERAEQQALGTLLQNAGHSGLRLLHACWTGQYGPLRQELARLREDEYRTFVQTALQCGLGESLACLIQGRGNAFLDVYLAAGATGERSLVALVQALLVVGEAAYLIRLVPSLARQSARELRTIAKIIARQPDVPEVFRCAVNTTTAALPPSKGLRRLLQTLLEPRRGKTGPED